MPPASLYWLASSCCCSISVTDSVGPGEPFSSSPMDSRLDGTSSASPRTCERDVIASTLRSSHVLWPSDCRMDSGGGRHALFLAFFVKRFRVLANLPHYSPSLSPVCWGIAVSSSSSPAFIWENEHRPWMCVFGVISPEPGRWRVWAKLALIFRIEPDARLVIMGGGVPGRKLFVFLVLVAILSLVVLIMETRYRHPWNDWVQFLICFGGT